MKDVPGVGVECATEVACQAGSVELSDTKRSVHAMKVDPHVHESELSDDIYIEDKAGTGDDQDQGEVQALPGGGVLAGRSRSQKCT